MADTLTARMRFAAAQSPNAAPLGALINHPEVVAAFNFQNHSVATWVETTGTPALAIVNGVAKRSTVTATLTEHGAGRTFARITGIIIIVEPNAAGAYSGYVSVALTGFNGATSADVRLYANSVIALLNTTGVAADDDCSATLAFAAAVNLKATVYLVAEPV